VPASNTNADAFSAPALISLSLSVVPSVVVVTFPSSSYKT